MTVVTGECCFRGCKNDAELRVEHESHTKTCGQHLERLRPWVGEGALPRAATEPMVRQGIGELHGFANHLDKTGATITAAQLREVLELAEQTLDTQAELGRMTTAFARERHENVLKELEVAQADHVDRLKAQRDVDELCRRVFQELDISHPSLPIIEGLKRVLRGEPDADRA